MEVGKKKKERKEQTSKKDEEHVETLEQVVKGKTERLEKLEGDVKQQWAQAKEDQPILAETVAEERSNTVVIKGLTEGGNDQSLVGKIM